MTEDERRLGACLGVQRRGVTWLFVVLSAVIVPPIGFLGTFGAPLPLVALLLVVAAMIFGAGLLPLSIHLARYDRGFVYGGYFDRVMVRYHDLVAVTSPTAAVSADDEVDLAQIATEDGLEPTFWGVKGRVLRLTAAEAREFQPLLGEIVQHAVRACVARADQLLHSGGEYLCPIAPGSYATADALHGASVALLRARPMALSWAEIAAIEAFRERATPRGGAPAMAVRGLSQDYVLRAVAVAQVRRAEKRRDR